MRIRLVFGLLFVGGCFLALACSAADTLPSVVINEIAWMGTENSANDEWIELHNDTDQDIVLDGWMLKAADGTPDIALTGVITTHGFFLLERTDDSTVPDTEADQIYSGALNNSGEVLELIDAEGNIVDTVNCASGWFSGDNTAKQTMERAASEWQTSADAGGTPRALNSGGTAPEPEDTDEPAPPEAGSSSPPPSNQPPSAEAGPDINALAGDELFFDAGSSQDPDSDPLSFFWNFGDGSSDTAEKTSHVFPYPGQFIVTLSVSDGEFTDLDMAAINIYDQSVTISEFLPSPEGSDDEEEWIEIYNQSNRIGNLSGWQIDDQEGGSRPFTFPANSFIAPHQFLVISRPVSKIALNNDADQVRLLYPDGSIAIQVGYEADQEGYTVAFDGQNYVWTTMPTPGLANIISGTEPVEAPEPRANNPILKTRELPQAAIALNTFTPEDFSANPASRDAPQAALPTEEACADELCPIEPEAVQQAAASPQRSKLILTISIILSASLLTGWFFAVIRKKMLAP